MASGKKKKEIVKRDWSKWFNYLVLIIPFLLYVNTLFNSYSFDDSFVVYKNPQIERGFSAIPEIFTSHYNEEPGNTFGYRPVVRSMYAIEYGIWGASPALSHFVNILLYVITCWLLYKLLRKVFAEGNSLWAFLAVLVFAAHPLHTEVVASLKNREDLLVMLLGLWLCHLFLKTVNQPSIFRYLLMVVIVFAAMLTKENGITFIPIAVLFAWFAVKQPVLWHLKRNLFPAAGLLIVAYIAYRFPEWILSPEDKVLFAFENPLHDPALAGSDWLLSGITTGWYLLKILVPYPLLFYYGADMLSIPEISNPYLWISVIVHLMLAGFAVYGFLSRNIYSVAILVYLAGLSVFTNWLFPINGIVAERLAYVASIGFALAVASLMIQANRNQKWRKLVWACFILLMIVYSSITVNRNTHWKNEWTLVSHDIPFLEKSAKAQTVCATLMLREMNDSISAGYKVHPGTIDRIVNHYKRSVEIFEDYYSSYNNLGLLYLKYKTDYSAALKYFDLTLTYKSNHPEAMFNRAFALEILDRKKEAADAYRLLLKTDSTHIFGRSYLANLLFNIGDTSSAVKENEILMRIAPATDLPYINLGNYALLASDTARAALYWETALSKNPNNPGLAYGLGMYYSQHGNPEKGKKYLEMAGRK